MKFIQLPKTPVTFRSLAFLALSIFTFCQGYSSNLPPTKAAQLATKYDNLVKADMEYSLAGCEAELDLYGSFIATRRAYYASTAMLAEETQCQSVAACDYDGRQNNFMGDYCGTDPLTIGATGNAGMEVGVIGQGLMIPAGATILSADIQFTAAANSTGAASLTIYGIAEDDPGAFSATDDIFGRPRTAALLNLGHQELGQLEMLVQHSRLQTLQQ